MRVFWGLTLRGRLMIIGLVGVAVSLLVGGIAFYGTLTYAVDRTLDNEALNSAEEVAAMVNENRLPSPVPVSGAQLVQVVDARQRVVGGSITADRLTPLLRPDELARALTGEAVVVDGSRVGLSEPLRTRAVSAGPGNARVSVVVALPVGDVLATRVVLRNALLITFPLVLLVVAAVAWRVIGWTLRPVEQLRIGAERISGAGQDERLPVPPAADEIHSLALTLNGMLDRLSAARGRQRAFVADAAHELRSPLASIQAQLEVAERLGEGGTLPAELLIDVQRLSTLVEDLLLLARSDADVRRPARVRALDVADLLTELAERRQHDPVPVQVQAPAGVSVTADPDELRRAVDNLVGNAVRHARSAVALAAEVVRDQVLITVSDDGPGVPAAERERVFERFTRLDEARARGGGGSGLGLAIARELVTRAGGEVSLQDAPPPWSVQAVVRLPVTT
ncbi:MAG TPA: HAMP domain-containing sensor histidine kinase [Propionibacteriaceae bacterium]